MIPAEATAKVSLADIEERRSSCFPDMDVKIEILGHL